MPMKRLQPPLRLTPEQALTVIEALDQLQHALWHHYGAAIQTRPPPAPSSSATADFDDPIPF